VPDKVKFFSKEWCEQAIKAINASEAMYKGFRDPNNFTNKMQFDCEDRPDLTVHLEWEKAKLVYLGPPTFPDEDLWLIIRASVDTWKTAAEGAVEGGKLLMGGKIKFVKGPITAAVQNAGAFNNFLLAWGQVPTDWDV
jgi:putative sterol carrier protein